MIGNALAVLPWAAFLVLIVALFPSTIQTKAPTEYESAGADPTEELVSDEYSSTS